MHIHGFSAERLPRAVTGLVDLALAEGFTFAECLVAEWISGQNRFDAPGECFLIAHAERRWVGFGGLNVDPFQPLPNVGRVRHVFVDPDSRGQGIGSALVRELVRRAQPSFSRLRLATKQAAPFYEQLGFIPVEEPKATHAMALTGSTSAPGSTRTSC